MIEKVDKNRMIKQICVCIWIIICNIAVQLLSEPLKELGFINWAFFLVNILFFLSGEENIKKKFAMAFGGCIVGILMTVVLLSAHTILLEAGLSGKLSLIIPMSICLIIMIVPIPVCPILFNSFGFAYFTVSLISSATSVQNAPIYIIEAILGNIILNGSIVLILGYLTKRAMKKAARTSAAANK